MFFDPTTSGVAIQQRSRAPWGLDWIHKLREDLSVRVDGARKRREAAETLRQELQAERLRVARFLEGDSKPK